MFFNYYKIKMTIPFITNYIEFPKPIKKYNRNNI